MLAWQALFNEVRGDDMIEKKSHNKEPKNALDAVSLPVNRALECCNPETIAKLGIPALQFIAQLTSREVIYPRLEKLDRSRISEAIDHLQTSEARSETAFWNLASKVFVANENGVVESLKSKGNVFRNGEDRSQFLARMMSENPENIGSFLASHLESTPGDIVGTTYRIFQSPLSPSELESKLVQITPEVLQKELIELLPTRGFGTYCKVTLTRFGHFNAYIINRGAYRIQKAVVDLDETQQFVNNRNVRTDVIVVMPESGTVWIHTLSKGEAEGYARCVATILGNPDLLKARKTFDMSMFLRRDVGADVLRSASSAGFARAELKSITIKDVYGSPTTHPAKRGTCLLERYHTLSGISEANEVVSVKIRLVNSVDGKDYSDIELKMESLAVAPSVEPSTVVDFLTKLKAWKPYAHC